MPISCVDTEQQANCRDILITSVLSVQWSKPVQLNQSEHRLHVQFEHLQSVGVLNTGRALRPSLEGFCLSECFIYVLKFSSVSLVFFVVIKPRRPLMFCFYPVCLCRCISWVTPRFKRARLLFRPPHGFISHLERFCLCFLKVDPMLCTVLVSDFLPGSICSVQPDAASVGTYFNNNNK